MNPTIGQAGHTLAVCESASGTPAHLLDRQPSNLLAIEFLPKRPPLGTYWATLESGEVNCAKEGFTVRAPQHALYGRSERSFLLPHRVSIVGVVFVIEQLVGEEHGKRAVVEAKTDHVLLHLDLRGAVEP